MRHKQTVVTVPSEKEQLQRPESLNNASDVNELMKLHALDMYCLKDCVAVHTITIMHAHLGAGNGSRETQAVVHNTYKHTYRKSSTMLRASF